MCVLMVRMVSGVSVETNLLGHSKLEHRSDGNRFQCYKLSSMLTNPNPSPNPATDAAYGGSSSLCWIDDGIYSYTSTLNIDFVLPKLTLTKPHRDKQLLGTNYEPDQCVLRITRWSYTLYSYIC